MPMEKPVKLTTNFIVLVRGDVHIHSFIYLSAVGLGQGLSTKAWPVLRGI